MVYAGIYRRNPSQVDSSWGVESETPVFKFSNTKKYHVFAPNGRFQLELIYLYFPPSSHLLCLAIRSAKMTDFSANTFWTGISVMKIDHDEFDGFPPMFTQVTVASVSCRFEIGTV
jgi:hypothetical protein